MTLLGSPAEHQGDEEEGEGRVGSCEKGGGGGVGRCGEGGKEERGKGGGTWVLRNERKGMRKEKGERKRVEEQRERGRGEGKVDEGAS